MRYQVGHVVTGEAQDGAGPSYVLVIDDDDSIRETLEAVLEDEGFAVQCAANGREALELLRAASQPPAVILLDLMMPVMSGLEFRAEQRRDPTLASIPVVVLSADGDARLKAEALQVQTFLAKPMSLTSLLAAVRAHWPPGGEGTAA